MFYLSFFRTFAPIFHFKLWNFCWRGAQGTLATPLYIPIYITCLIVCFIPSLLVLSRESDGSAIFWTDPHSLRSCQFPSFPLDSLNSSQLICYSCSKPPKEMIVIALSKDATIRREWETQPVTMVAEMVL